jgi:DNA polymerase-4
VVAAASYEARRYGVHSAMPGFQARKLCPGGVFVGSRMSHYAEVSRQVRTVFEQFTPEIEPLALDEAFLDITGSLALFGPPRGLAQALKEQVRRAVGLVVSVGVSPNKLVSKIACTLGKPDGLKVVEADEVGAFLDPLSIARLWGVGPVAREKLARLGVHTFGDLRTYDPEWLVRELGERALELQRLARGEDRSPVVADRAPKSIGEENTFERDVSDRSVIVDTLAAHAQAVARRLRRVGSVGRTVTLKVKLAERRTDSVDSEQQVPSRLYPVLTRRCTMDPPTDDDVLLKQCAVRLWDQAAVQRPVRLIGLSVGGLASAASGRQLSLFAGDEPARSVGPALDAIERRFGSGAIYRGVELPDKLTPSGRPKEDG